MRIDAILDYIPIVSEHIDEYTYYEMNNEALIYEMKEKFNQLINES